MSQPGLEYLPGNLRDKNISLMTVNVFFSHLAASF